MSKPRRTADTRDPRFLPFRVAAYALYLFVVVTFSTLLIISVVRSILAMSPPKKTSAGQVLSSRECAERAEELWGELDSQRQAMSRYAKRRDMEEQWSDFRVNWLKKVREIEAVCAPQSRARSPLKKAFELLVHLQNLYSTHAVQFAGEIGGSLEEFRQALEASKK